jgi:PAS domain S-box-containing protein
VGESVVRQVVRKREVAFTDDYVADASSPDEAAAVERLGVRSLAVAPLGAETRALGTLGVFSDRPGRWDRDRAELLAALADQAAIAVTNARLIEELERSRGELARRVESERALREIAARVTALHEPDEVLSQVVDEASRLLGSDGGHLTLLDEDGRLLEPVVVAGVRDAGTEAWFRRRRFPIGTGINGLAAGENRVVSTYDYPIDPRISEDAAQDFAARLRIRGMAAAPLREPGGGVIGTLAISYAEPREFGAEELALLQGLADHAAIAVANSRLVERLRASESRYRHLVQNSPDLVWAIDADARFTFLSDTAERLSGWRPDELLGQHFGAIIHESSRDVAEIDWTLAMAAPTQELRGRISLLHRDGHPIPAEFIAQTRIEDGRFAGANGSVRDMTERDRLESGLRRQAAELAASEERAHLARELHDSVTQALFSMTLLTRSIELLMARDVDAARGKLGALRDLQRDALAEMRSLIFELRPGSLEQDGLVHALRTHCAAVEGRIGLPILLDAGSMTRLPIEIEDALYRIAQEALHNVVKHAGARQVRIGLHAIGDRVRLRIEDDGKGFDPSAVPAGHLGVAGMRARAERTGATLVVDSRPGAGTRIEVTAPLALPDEVASGTQAAAAIGAAVGGNGQMT